MPQVDNSIFAHTTYMQTVIFTFTFFSIMLIPGFFFEWEFLLKLGKTAKRLFDSFLEPFFKEF